MQQKKAVSGMLSIPEGVRALLETLEAAGYEAWCVGGCVRDMLLADLRMLNGAQPPVREPEDWDVTTSALPEETLAVFGDRALPTGLKHGTVTVRTADGPAEVTTYRLDGAYRDRRHPESVTFTRSLEEDLARRDFTVNAMALNLRGELRDPFGGRRDLENGDLRCVGAPDRRFQEDALRILRGMRFSAALGLDEEDETGRAIDRNRELLREIAPERIQAELTKLLCGRYAKEVLDNHPGVVGVFWPEALPMVGFDQRNIHHCYDVWNHSTVALANTPPIPELRCAALLHDIGKPAAFTLDEDGVGHFYGHAAASVELADGMLRRLKFPNDFRERVVRLVAWHDRDIPRTDRGVGRALRRLGEEELRLLLALKRADNLAQASAYRGRQAEIALAEEILDRLLAENACFSLKQLAVNGNDLTALGLRGPAVGRALETLLSKVVDGELPNQRAALLKFVTES
ncbi:CCA tRNA nucleotidyltransferase [Oscillibacter sp. 1-3]|uniref:CCA tRNA nucleotidyltransferase n=1 Tax=Oscillibacter sp. 1-3 TaxID=1235797 RepID=UPI00039B18D6|nr:HD domain-containing protein [Oscillibacter sp. 1-3]